MTVSHQQTMMTLVLVGTRLSFRCRFVVSVIVFVSQVLKFTEYEWWLLVMLVIIVLVMRALNRFA